jgi:adenylosuccinate synthase
LSALAVTRLDVLDGINPLKICHSYKYGSEKIDNFPGNLKLLGKCEPQYIELPGWKKISEEEWHEIISKGYDALPENLKKYLEYIENDCNVPAKIISVGPAREETIIKE